jgi:hypothetical protein
MRHIAYGEVRNRPRARSHALDYEKEERTYERPAERLAARDEPPVELERDKELPDVHTEEYERIIRDDICAGRCQQEWTHPDNVAGKQRDEEGSRGHARTTRACSAGECQSTILSNARGR